MSSLRAAEELHADGLPQGSGRRKGLRTDVQSCAAEVFCQFAAQITDDGEQQIIRIAEIGRRVRLYPFTQVREFAYVLRRCSGPHCTLVEKIEEKVLNGS